MGREFEAKVLISADEFIVNEPENYHIFSVVNEWL